MRVLVTGAGNPHGRAIVRALVKSGHQVRVFGGDSGVMEAFSGLGPGEAHWHPGDPALGGSIEPSLSERQALIHAAALDAPLGSRAAQVERIVQGARYARYGAEREQVDHFLLVTPDDPPKGLGKAHADAVAHCESARGVMNRAVVRAASDPAATAAEVVRLLGGLPELGKQPGRENDAVTA